MAKQKILEIPCIEVEQGDKRVYLFSEKAKTMWDILSINRRVEDKDEGYQRALSISRVKSIARYIDSGNPIPQSLLICLDDAEVNAQAGGKKSLRIKVRKDVGWVIDGQHRFAGAYQAKNDIELLFVAFIGLDISDQIKLFITINQEAKGVPSSLYLDLLKTFPNKTPAEQTKERVADIATDLRRDEASPFYGKIVVTSSPRKGELSLTNFVRKINPLLVPNKGILAVYTIAEQKSIISNYYLALKNSFPKEFNRYDSIFFQTLGFGALMNSLPTFFSLCLKEYNGFTVEDATKLFAKIDYFPFEEWRGKGTGNSAEIEAGNDLITELTAGFDNRENSKGSLRL